MRCLTSRGQCIAEPLGDFKRRLLDIYERYPEHAEPEVARAIVESDVIMLETQVSRFARKRNFGKLRATKLSGKWRRGAPD